MLDWDAAEESLYSISKEEITRFLGRADRDDVYGFGFFCDVIEGVMLVANTRSFHEAGFRESVEKWGPTDEETFRWDIGNWEYPAGLACSSDEETTFDIAWEKVQASFSESADDRDQEPLVGLCIRVLRRLFNEGVFSGASGLEGFVVLGPDDSSHDVLAKKHQLDEILNTGG